MSTTKTKSFSNQVIAFDYKSFFCSCHILFFYHETETQSVKSVEQLPVAYIKRGQRGVITLGYENWLSCFTTVERVKFRVARGAASQTRLTAPRGRERDMTTLLLDTQRQRPVLCLSFSSLLSPKVAQCKQVSHKTVGCGSNGSPMVLGFISFLLVCS